MAEQRTFENFFLTDAFSALCGALHKADYVDRSIMWTIEGGKF